jgi:hypothetical protein
VGVGLKLVAVAIAGVVVLVVCAGLAGGATSGESTGAGCQVSSGGAHQEGAAIPADYFPWLQEAAAKYHLGPEGAAIVAAIHYVESDWDQSPLPGVAPGTQNSAGAEGPGQFLVPSWEAYGVDADGDGVADPYSVPDSVFATANLLHADGAPGNWRQAIFDYNHAWWYVDEVLEKAEHLGLRTICEAAIPTSIEGTAKTMERIRSVAAWIEGKRFHYCWGGGHGPKPGPSAGTRVESQCPPGTLGLDCSGSVRWLMVLSGFPDPGGLVSDELGATFLPGPGTEVTVWSNPDHIWMEIDGRDWGTATSNPFGGPGYGPQSRYGFLPTHPAGL